MINHDTDRIRELEQENSFLRSKVKTQRLIVDRMPAMIAYWDKNQRCRFANSAYFEWFEVTPETLFGRTMLDLLGRELYQKNLPYIRGALQGKPQLFERELTKRQTGEVCQTQAHYIPDIVDDEVQGFFVLVADVSERKRAEVDALNAKEALHRANENLEQLVRERTQKLELAKKSAEKLAGDLNTALQVREKFLAIASHELKTPLTTLKLKNNLFRRVLDSVKSSRLPTFEKLEKISEGRDQEIERLSRLVDDMLDVSRMSIGLLSLRRERTDLGAIVRNVLEQFDSRIRSAACKLTANISCAVCGQWDETRLEQVIENLLTNALKYGRGQPIHIAVLRDGSNARLDVQDHGIGINPEDQQRIFLAFERAISENEVSGMGIGLYVANEIVRAHKGEIRLESAPGTGSIFTVLLPT